jgi:outer membrane protein TolC
MAAINPLFAQSPPPSPDRPWHSSDERQIIGDARRFHPPALRIQSDRIYSLAELIDLAEAHNPETRVAWENARAQAAAVGIARSDLFPALAAVALSGVDRNEVPLGAQFYRQTVPAFELSLDLNYTIFDFGARRGRINAESARLLASNFAFNGVHRQLIYEVSQAYYRLLNAAGQEEAAGASLVNAQAVQQAAEERLRNGLATLPDVLEARSATAQAQYDLQAVLGAEEIARGDLATALGASATTRVRVQPLSEVATPESVADTVEQAISRALEQRPDLQAQVSEIHLAQAERQQARSVFYPSLSVAASPSAQSLYFQQQNLPWGHTADLTGGVTLSLNWAVFDGGARRSRLAQAEAHIRQAEAQVSVVRDRIEDQVWTTYSNLNTAFRQREAATALVTAATQSYSAALESYNTVYATCWTSLALRRSLPKPVRPTFWRVFRCWRRSRIWHSAQAMPFKRNTGQLTHEQSQIPSVFETGAVSCSTPLDQLWPSPVLRHPGFLLSRMDPVLGLGINAHGRGPLAADPRWCCSRDSSIHLSESERAVHICTLARLV